MVTVVTSNAQLSAAIPAIPLAGVGLQRIDQIMPRLLAQYAARAQIRFRVLTPGDSSGASATSMADSNRTT